jgi:hypothetical protein
VGGTPRVLGPSALGAYGASRWALPAAFDLENRAQAEPTCKSASNQKFGFPTFLGILSQTNQSEKKHNSTRRRDESTKPPKEGEKPLCSF